MSGHGSFLNPPLSCHAHVTSGKFDGVQEYLSHKCRICSNLAIPTQETVKSARVSGHWPVGREGSVVRGRKGKEGESLLRSCSEWKGAKKDVARARNTDENISLPHI